MRKYWYGGVLVLAFANILVWPEVFSVRGLQVTFFDVGQGDAIFIETPQGHQVLIDGGPSGSRLTEKLGDALPFWDRSLDMVLLTHPDADHLTGLVAALERYEVEHIVWNGVEKDTKVFEAWEEALAAEHARVVTPEAPQRIILGDAKLIILHAEEGSSAVNDTSIISKLVYGEHSFLFPGDISKKVENKLVGLGIELESDILKVPHHGSKTSSAEAFVAAVNPEVAVMQVGADNRYGHPHEEVVRRYSAFQIPILRTDKIGDIVIQL